MKWFKHYSDALDDPFIQELLDEFGHLGYVVWFGLIEIICKENGNKITGKLTVSPEYLRRKFRTTPAKLRQVLDKCRASERLMLDCFEKKWFIEFPKIQEIKDNYIKDLQGSCKKLAHYKEEEEYKEEKEEEKEKTIVVAKNKVSFNLETHTFENFDNGKLSKLVEAYPAVDVPLEIKAMETWLMANPKNLKSNYERFIVTWLKKAQDKAPRQEAYRW
jgi:hypothetical protein